jgi:hypothetical protein
MIASQAKVDAGTDAVTAVPPAYLAKKLAAPQRHLSVDAAAVGSALVAAGAVTADQATLNKVVAPLYRSPNTINALAIYDTTLDSDGGAWTDKCSSASWYSEPLSGKWLGAVSHISAALHSEANGWEMLHVKPVPGVGTVHQPIAGCYVRKEVGPYDAIPGNIDVRCKVSLPNWVPAVNSALVTHYNSVGNSTFLFRATSGGYLGLTRSNGTSSASTQSSVVHGFSAGSVQWVRFTLDVISGAVIFYTSPDGVVWTQLGATQTIATLLANPATAFHTYYELGGYGLGTAEFNGGGTFYYAEVRRGIDGPVVVKFDGSTIVANAPGDYYQLSTDGKFYQIPENFSLNNQMAGAVVGVVGSGGVLPHGWSVSSPGCSQEVIGTGTDANGRKYLDLRFFGTPTTVSGSIRLTDGGTNTQFRVGEKLTLSTFVSSSSSGVTNADYFVDPYTPAYGSPDSRVSGTTFSITSTATKQTQTLTSTGANSSVGQVYLRLNWPSGVALDYTLRIAEPEVVRGAVAGSMQAKSLNSVAIQTYRGNKAAFPKVVGIVGEVNGVTLYDLSDRSMWKVLPNLTNSALSYDLVSANSGALASINWALGTQGSVYVAAGTSGNNAGLRILNFAGDYAEFTTDSTRSGTGRFNGGLGSAERALGGRPTLGTARSLLASTGNYVCSTVLPGAPLDMATGLAVPTVAVSTTSGLSVIKHDGTVVNPFASFSSGGIGFNKRGDLLLTLSDGGQNIRKSLAPSYSSVVVVADGLISGGVSVLTSGSSNNQVFDGQALLAGSAADIYKYRPNDTSATANGVMARIHPYFNTGYMPGNIRRTLIAEASSLGYTYGPDIVSGDSRDFTSGVGAWATSVNYASTASATGGELVVTATAAYGRQVLAIPTEIGSTYLASVTARKVSGTGFAAIDTVASGGSNLFPTKNSIYGLTNDRYEVSFIATGTTSYVALGEGAAVAGGVHAFDNFRVRKVSSGTVIERPLTAVNKVFNGTFTTDASGWTGNASTTISAAGGVGIFTSASTATGFGGSTDVNTTVGVSYEITFDLVANSTGGSISLNVGVAGTYGSASLGQTNFGSATGTGYKMRFTATSAAHSFTFTTNPGVAIGLSYSVDNVTVYEVAMDRSYKGKPSAVTGSLVRSPVAVGADTVAYSGFSSANYLQEAYSADLDFGTGAWSVSAWAQLPATVTANTMTGAVWAEATGSELFNTAAVTLEGESTQVSTGVYRIYSSAGAGSSVYSTSPGNSIGKSYKVTVTVDSVTNVGGGITVEGGYLLNQTAQTMTAVGTYTWYVVASTTGVKIKRAATCDYQVSGISIKEVTPAIIAERGTSSGARIRLGVGVNGGFYAEAYDGTTTRFAYTTTSYATGAFHQVRAQYTTDGKLALVVNGEVVGAATGTPLLALSNASGLLTTGNSYLFTSPFPGQLAQVKWSATVPTTEQTRWMYNQEAQMFKVGAITTTPSYAGMITNSYDADLDRWSVLSASWDSQWTGLVRTAYTPLVYGSYIRTSYGAGHTLLARTGTAAGADITAPSRSVREGLLARRNGSAAKSRQPLDFDAVSFTGTTTSASSQVTSVTAVVGTPVVGMAVSGTGIPVGTTIVSISGATYTMSANATAAGTVTISQTDFALPVGFAAVDVRLNGALQREGSTKSYVRYFDGFVEYVRLNTAPGTNAWIQVTAER